MLSSLRAILQGFLIVGVTFTLSLVGIVTWPLSPRGDLYCRLARFWSRFSFWLTGVRVTVGGRERIDWSRPYVVVANHQSAADTMALFHAVPVPLRFLAKRQLMYLPVFGWGMALARFIWMDRDNARKALRAIDRAAERVRAGESVAIFPEGTRSDDGRVGEFKRGGFRLAEKAGVAILPVAIVGSNRCLAKGELRIHPGRFHVEIGAPFVPEQRPAGDGADALMARVRARLVDLVGDNDAARYADATVLTRFEHEERHRDVAPHQDPAQASGDRA